MICVDTTFLVDLWREDLWIAAWAAEHSAQLATRNAKHFEDVPGVHLIAYAR